MIKKCFLYPVLGLLLSACQTNFPVATEQQLCNDTVEAIELTDIDYLLFANRMIDSMIHHKNIQQEIIGNRMTLSILPVENNTSEAINMIAINKAIKNRVLRSGQFIINESASGPFQLSGTFANKQRSSSACAETYTQFSLQLMNTQNKRILWSEDTKFN